MNWVRCKESPADEIIQVTAPSDVYKYLRNTFVHINHEEFWILLLNLSNKITGKYLIIKGGQAGAVADPKIIFKTALGNNAPHSALAHNHPSESLNPSESNNWLTKDAVASGLMLGLQVIDHLIFTDNGYYSYNDEGLM